MKTNTPAITCSKTYTDLPFAHRQPSHQGHCALIHGHNWSFEFEFAADKLDECGFVIDFGKLKWLKDWINERFDHTLVLNESDPMLDFLNRSLTAPGEPENSGLAKIVTLPDCSCEGLCAYLLEQVDQLVSHQTQGRVRVIRCRVIEDSKNYATACR